MRRLPCVLSTLAALAAGAPVLPAHAQRSPGRPSAAEPPVVPLDVWRPRTLAIATFAPERSNPSMIEATEDGWVVLRHLEGELEARERPSASRLLARPAEVRRWADEVRARLGAGESAHARGAEVTPLGQGHSRLQVTVHERPQQVGVYVSFVDCAGIQRGYTAKADDLLRMAERLTRAAQVAGRESPEPALPTLQRAYYATEVGCPASPAATNPVPRFPDEVPADARRFEEVGVRLVVDTAGVPEPASIAVLPGATPALARAARALVERWRYRPAEVAGLPVRQVVTHVVAFDPAGLAPLAPPPRPREYWMRGPTLRTEVRADADGWVRVRFAGWRLNHTVTAGQDWFAPDSVDAWLARVRAFLAADSANPRLVRTPGERPVVALGPDSGGNRFVVAHSIDYVSDTSRLAVIGHLRGCAVELHQEVPVDAPLLAAFARASREARALRTTPPRRAGRVHASGDVGCPPALAPVAARHRSAPGVWRHRMGPYPASMARARARAEVLASVVVDTLGAPVPETLVTMPGADPRAADALRADIRAFGFEPATRGGRRVAVRVVRPWYFAPPPECDGDAAAVDCPREYGPMRRAR
ncbi:hypothetical protein [Roseisolibacter sp. H3M3-2]|uniref:hypothetical protein n=1 Tax=Roseisolibacter sp. H3M3-2 TaxID=3031323 RepID=UPI0023D9E44B|nr:hypothetical protein [Roseisolibacter sp. H3M3-2]